MVRNDNLANKDLRDAIVKNGYFFWQIARRCGVTASTFSVWMREELPPDDPRRIKIQKALEGTAAEDGAQQEETA